MDQAGESKVKKEAIRYRQQLRETEAKLASVAAVVVRDKLADLNIGLEALIAAGTKAADLFDAEGQFDDAQLLAAVVNTHDKLGIKQGARLPEIIAGYKSSGTVAWHATVGGYVGSAGTGEDGIRPTFEQRKEAAYERARAQNTNTDIHPESDYAQKWNDILSNTGNTDIPPEPATPSW